MNPNIPILFYTILEREDLDTDLFQRRGPNRTTDHLKKHADVGYARKDDDEGRLKEKLRHFLIGGGLETAQRDRSQRCTGSGLAPLTAPRSGPGTYPYVPSERLLE